MIYEKTHVYVRPSFRKRLALHSLPLLLMVLGTTGFLSLSVLAERGNLLAQALLKPAVGAGVLLPENGRAQAMLYNTQMVDEAPGVINKLSRQQTASETGELPSIENVNRALSLQLALDGASVRRER